MKVIPVKSTESGKLDVRVQTARDDIKDKETKEIKYPKGHRFLSAFLDGRVRPVIATPIEEFDFKSGIFTKTDKVALDALYNDDEDPVEQAQ